MEDSNSDSGLPGRDEKREHAIQDWRSDRAVRMIAVVTGAFLAMGYLVVSAAYLLQTDGDAWQRVAFLSITLFLTLVSWGVYVLVGIGVLRFVRRARR